MKNELISLVREDLKRDEGFMSKPYTDTVGKLTIGYGRNLDDVGISQEEAEFLLDRDIKNSISDLNRNIGWWRDLPLQWQRALVNMAFNLGWPKLSEFEKMLESLKSGDGLAASRHALDSKWASQVHSRADRVSALFRSD